MAQRLAEIYGFSIAPTIRDDITGGTNDVIVAGVLSIGEHGDYAVNALGQ